MNGGLTHTDCCLVNDKVNQFRFTSNEREKEKEKKVNVSQINRAFLVCVCMLAVCTGDSNCRCTDGANHKLLRHCPSSWPVTEAEMRKSST